LRYEEGPGGFDCKGILDPRFPEVREYLITIYEKALKDWDLDGFKLDFVDCFFGGPECLPGDGRDIASVPEAADRLLSNVMARLRHLKPKIMIEFRQAYIGPLMRKYGNMFRAADCPNNALQNHVRVLDLRQLAAGTAVHSDMLLWHAKDSPESAALQLLAVIFSVPQISVLLDKLPKSHIEMLKFWLGFWRRHRDALLDGKLEAPHPEQQYPMVTASTKSKKILAVSGGRLASFGKKLPKELYVINATANPDLVLELGEDFGRAKIEVFDCRGRSGKARAIQLKKGLHALSVPPSGLASIRRS
jgi:alpha-galactosidase